MGNKIASIKLMAKWGLNTPKLHLELRQFDQDKQFPLGLRKMGNLIVLTLRI